MPLITALNPSIDFEWKVDQVRWEEKNTVQSERRWAGGKGVNVARWVQHLGGKPRLLLPLGGPAGKELADYLKREKLAAKTIPLREETRVNVIVTTADRRQMRFNPKGPRLSVREWQAVLDAVKRELVHARTLLLSGGLPRGLPADAYAQLLRQAHRAGVRSVLDCDGAALAAAVTAKPFLVKPNVHELAQWRGRSLSSLAQIKAAARAMSDVTRGWVMVSRGGDGALLVHNATKRVLIASAPKAKVVNTVGAGDALLAGVIRQIERDTPPEEWLRWGVTAGSAATQCMAGELARLSLIGEMLKRVRVRVER